MKQSIVQVFDMSKKLCCLEYSATKVKRFHRKEIR